jgi:hypothetical protein
VNAQNRNLALVLAFAVVMLVGIAGCRGGEYDEYYSIFLIAGDPRPAWPLTATTVAALSSSYHGHTSITAIANNLRRGDVHPPLYFWLLAGWRHLVGTGLFRFRLLSVGLTCAGMLSLSRIARHFGISAALAVAVTVLCYGFAYTGLVARNFALTDTISLTGVLLLINADRARSHRIALLAGIVLGGACFTNYLASFTTIAALAWMFAVNRPSKRLGIMPAIGAALFIPAGAYFFLAQSGSRHGQFHQFRLFRALTSLARDQIGAILGALPRYAPPPWSSLIAASVIIFAAILLFFVVPSGLASLPARYRTLIAAEIAAPPIGLLALGAVFNNAPIEMRYLWLGLPYIGLALAAGLRHRPRLCATLLAVQALSIIGLAIAPQTMQPASRTARIAAAASGPNAIVLVPFGNDGVGIPGPFVAAAQPTMTVLITRNAAPSLLNLAAHYNRVVIAEIKVDESSRAAIPQLDALFAKSPCWRVSPSPRAITVFTNLCRGNHA